MSVGVVVLADPGRYELANLNRQRAGVADIGRAKAAVLAERARQVNPHADVQVEPGGVTAENVARLVGDSDVVIDGIDVTTPEPIRDKIALHGAAAAARVPVLCGYDVAGTQALLVYDYRRRGRRALDGRIPLDQAASIGPLGFLARVVPAAAIPVEIVPELRRQAAGTSDGFPQLVYSADLFGVLAARAVCELLAGRPVRRSTIVDVHQLLRPWRQRLRVSAARAVALVGLAGEVRRARRGGTDARA